MADADSPEEVIGLDKDLPEWLTRCLICEAPGVVPVLTLEGYLCKKHAGEDEEN
jgi:hypothetical protein